MGPDVVLKMTESLQNRHCMIFFFDNLFNSPSVRMNLVYACVALALPKKIGKECQRFLLTEKGREMISSNCIPAE